MSPDLVAAVTERLKAWPPLTGPGGLASVEDALAFADLVQRGGMPARTPAAYVLPAAEDAGPQQTVTLVIRQLVTETVSVVVLTRSADRLGAAARDQVSALRAGVRAALLGWEPGGGWSPMTFRRSRLAGLQGGAASLTMDFQATDLIEGPAPLPEEG